jgi:RNA polymerase sigma factor (sigma-70 family)
LKEECMDALWDAVLDVGGNGSDRSIDLWAAVGQLPDKQQEVMLYSFLGYTQEEIAEMCGVKQAAVSRRFSRACEELRGQM